MSKTLICGNCGHKALELIGQIDSADKLIPTSDGQFADCMHATRLHCKRCGVIETFYEPADRLSHFFNEQYDTSDRVQNNIIIKNMLPSNKHVDIFNQFISTATDLPECGEMIDVGCGQGRFIKRFGDYFPNWNCIGVDPSAPVDASLGSIRFVHSFFERSCFQDRAYKVIAAHGLLNRTPTLPCLLDFAALCAPNALLSVEVILLEQALFAPHIWDHPYMFRRDVFESYLEYAGFKILNKYDCNASIHYLCRCEDRSLDSPPPGLKIDQVENSHLLYMAYSDGWEKVFERVRSILHDSKDESIGLFGAGIFSAALLGTISCKEIAFILDEIRHGSMMLDIPIVEWSALKQHSNPHVVAGSGYKSNDSLLQIAHCISARNHFIAAAPPVPCGCYAVVDQVC